MFCRALEALGQEAWKLGKAQQLIGFGYLENNTLELQNRCPEALKSYPEAPKSSLGNLLGRLGSLLEPLGRALEALRGLSGVSSALLEGSWGPLGRSWELLEASWERLGRLLGVLCSHLGRFLELERDLRSILEAITLNYEKPQKHGKVLHKSRFGG